MTAAATTIVGACASGGGNRIRNAQQQHASAGRRQGIRQQQSRRSDEQAGSSGIDEWIAGSLSSLIAHLPAVPIITPSFSRRGCCCCFWSIVQFEGTVPSPFSRLCPQAMLDQYSGENRGLRNLDSALRDAVQMVQVSDQRITYLRKMHALLLLRKCVPPSNLSSVFLWFALHLAPAIDRALRRCGCLRIRMRRSQRDPPPPTEACAAGWCAQVQSAALAQGEGGATII